MSGAASLGQRPRAWSAVGRWFRSRDPYLMLLGIVLFLLIWYLTVEVWRLPRFRDMPGLTDVVKEWFSRNPEYGLSIFVDEYYVHIGMSLRRIAIAFFAATLLGTSLGLALGWSKNFREFVFPVFELLRPVPVLAWVPLAIIMFKGSETPVIFLTGLAAFFVTTLNTMLGVQSIEENYFRAVGCLGASRAQTFWHVVLPGSLPFIFTGLEIAMGVAWFSLVAAEMISGEYGLGYVINTAYTKIQYPTIVIGMVTLGLAGFGSSALVRWLGRTLTQWRVKQLAIGR